MKTIMMMHFGIYVVGMTFEDLRIFRWIRWGYWSLTLVILYMRIVFMTSVYYKKFCIFLKKLLVIISVRIVIQIFIEFFNLSLYQQIHILFFILLFLFFSLKFIYFEFKKQIVLQYSRFIVLYFSKFWNVLFVVFFLILYILFYYSLFGTVECSDLNNNKTKAIAIGGGLLVTGGLGYYYVKPVIAKIIVNSQTELLYILKDNNKNIQSLYLDLYKNRCKPIDIEINSYITNCPFNYKDFYCNTNKKLSEPLMSYNEALSEVCELEIAGIFKTPALIYGRSYYMNVTEILQMQNKILEQLNFYKNSYEILINKLKIHYDIELLTLREQEELKLLTVKGTEINSLLYNYVTNLITIGDKSLSDALGMDLSVAILRQKVDPLSDPVAMANLNVTFDSLKLRVNEDVKVYEKLFFKEIDYTFVYDIVLLLVYSFYCLSSLYISSGNPIPKDYAITSCNRLFGFKKYKIHKYENHPEGGDDFWKLFRWYD